jgi:hypothetical protein
MRATIVEDMPMQKTIMAIITAGTIATAVIATPKPAEARCIGCWVGAGVAAGIIGGAIASQGYGYGYPAYGYGYGYPSYGYAPYVRASLLRRLLRAAPLLRAPLLSLLIDS